MKKDRLVCRAAAGMLVTAIAMVLMLMPPASSHSAPRAVKAKQSASATAGSRHTTTPNRRASIGSAISNRQHQANDAVRARRASTGRSAMGDRPAGAAPDVQGWKAPLSRQNASAILSPQPAAPKPRVHEAQDVQRRRTSSLGKILNFSVNADIKKANQYRKEEFKTNGLNVATRRQYLESSAGRLMQKMLKDADPGKPDYIYKSRADNLLKSGKDMPAMRTVRSNESLYKLVKIGEQPSPHSPYWITGSELAALRRNPANIADRLGLPNDSVSPSGRYAIWETKPAGGKAPTVFESTIAPTVEGGTVRTGGGTQALILNRHEWQPPVLTNSFP